MPLFKKKPPPIWFVLRPPRGSSSTADPKREGPYTRATIIQMYGEGMLRDGALIWTNEKIFPNAQKPNSFRLVRIMEWRRLDQLPDPVIRQFDAEWHDMKNQQNNPTHLNTNDSEVSPTGLSSTQHPYHPTDGAPHPPSGGMQTGSHPQPYHPAKAAVYPTGGNVHQNLNTPQNPDQVSPHLNSSSPPPPPPEDYPGHYQTSQQPPAPYSQSSAFPQPTAYPAAAAYPPPPAPGAH